MNKTIPLSNNVTIPLQGFGTYKLYGQDCEDAVYNAISAGYKLIDTARMYENELFVGNAIKRASSSFDIKREQLFITTKVWPNDYSTTKFRNSIYSSIKDLGVDYIDLCLLHNSLGNVYEAWETLIELYEKKIIRAIGVSNFSIGKMMEFIHFTNIHPMLNQIEIHPYYKRRKSIEYLRSIQCIPQAWAPLAECKFKILEDEIICSISKKYAKSPAQIILRWLIQQGIPYVVRTTNKEHLIENIDIWNFELLKEDMKLISELTKDDCKIINYDDPDIIQRILNKYPKEEE